ncbi:Hypothetical_protein [Hexamita inflata]|uniref:Hypothetical_protein n=1 Tax=Hexamita inflata TaxID=28002 RepID=A0AA86N6X3_9EUKA|nr:Hypothetical protein HINF_LOCUS1588 [Hexamita inflata]
MFQNARQVLVNSTLVFIVQQLDLFKLYARLSRLVCDSKVPVTGKNTLDIYYEENNVSHSLGFYRFHYAMNSLYYVYARPICKENQQLTKQKIKSAGFGIVFNV